MRPLRLGPALAAALMLLLPTTVHAVPLRADYALNFAPPNPCSDALAGATWGDYVLGGTLEVLVGDDRIGGGPRALGRAAVSGLACGGSVAGVLELGDTAPAGAALFVAFAGELTHPPEPGLPVFAFPAGTDLLTLGTAPDTAPLIGVGTSPGPPNLPLFAFASVHPAGTLQLTLRQVPEPGTLALLAVGLTAGGWMRRRSASAR